MVLFVEHTVDGKFQAVLEKVLGDFAVAWATVALVDEVLEEDVDETAVPVPDNEISREMEVDFLERSPRGERVGRS